MPPQPPTPFPERFPTAATRPLQHGIRYLLIATALLLTGCATNSNSQYASSDKRTARDHYLSHTQSDPLGAYLTKYQYPGPTNPEATKALAATALDFLGIKYRYGGGTPHTGFDCSGLVIYAAQKSLGLKLPRKAADIAHEGISVKRNDLKKGDLVFFNTRGHRNSHVGIYLGDHKFVHAPRAGSSVRVESMDIAYWKKRYNGARRLAQADIVSALRD